MTLQKKILDKKNKKGFTLVELVVVIAILAILAAVSIPMVITIIGNAAESTGETNASAVNEACKELYAGVRSGSLTSKSLCADGTPLNTGDNPTSLRAAAAPGASDYNKEWFASRLSPKVAQLYSGLNVSYDNLCYYTQNDDDTNHVKGDIVYYDGATLPDNTAKLEPSTPFYNMYAGLSCKAQSPNAYDGI